MRQTFSIASLLILLTGCASGSSYTLRLDDTTSLKVTEISRPNPVSPSNQYTVLWYCKEDKCVPKSVDHVSTHGWLVGIVKEAITSTGYAVGGWLSSSKVSISAKGADGGSGGSGGQGGDGGDGGGCRGNCGEGDD